MAKSNTWPGRYGFDHVICPPFLWMPVCPAGVGGNHPTERARQCDPPNRPSAARTVWFVTFSGEMGE
jgi:hypothetical protein